MSDTLPSVLVPGGIVLAIGVGHRRRDCADVDAVEIGCVAGLP